MKKAIKPKKSKSRGGVLFSMVDGKRQDAHIHEEMLPAGSFASDEAAIEILIKSGMTRPNARRFLRLGRGYGA
jgi:hypothetical protein